MQVLDDEWALATAPMNCGRAEGWFATAPNQARVAAIPGCIQQIFPNYHGVTWYWYSLPHRPDTLAHISTRIRRPTGLLLNLIGTAAEGSTTPFLLPEDFATPLEQIGYA